MSDENAKNNVSDDVLEAFDIMWGLHPSPVMLIKADRDIVAVNEAGKQLGIPAGVKCFQLTGQDKICNGCQGNPMLKENTAKRSTRWNVKLNMFADTYWIPVRGQDGLFIHFGNNITEYVKEELCG